MSDDPIYGLEKAAAENEVAFDYVKGPDFRAVWVDGALGGITPRGLIHCAIYAERHSIPRRQVFSVEMKSENIGALGPEIQEKLVTRGSIVREMAADLLMTPDVAEQLARWLLGRVEEMRSANESTKEGEK